MDGGSVPSRAGKGGPHVPIVHPSFGVYPGWLLISAGTLATCLGAASSLGGAGAASTVLQKKVVLTNASSGTTTVVTKGEDVVVKLSSPGFEWTEASVLSASPVAVLKKLSGHVSADGSSVTKFEVVGYGTASLEAIGNATCTASTSGGAWRRPHLVLWRANLTSPVVDPPLPSSD